jgi:Nif-specific regulatory protein
VARRKGQQSGEEARRAHELELLFDISRSLRTQLDLPDVLAPVLEQLAERLGLLRGTVALLDQERETISIEVSTGLTRAQQDQGHWKSGEGVTSEVIRTGQAVVVERVSEDPKFTNPTGARVAPEGEELAFVSVPIEAEGEVIGTLSADRVVQTGVDLEDDARLLSIIASLVGDAVNLRRKARTEARALERENERLRAELEQRFRPENIIGNSKAMLNVFALTSQVAQTATTVLILGESGTGKELIASAIHENSPRRKKPFVKVNCASLPETVIESELFGHEKGAFTGAVSRRQGRFELANGGTIFLDEIGEMSANMQVKLLRVLQERQFERVGGTETLEVDVRVIAATNRDLDAGVAAGVFREDLYYRLNVFPIRLPPLRERRSDILLLANRFIERFNRMHGKAVRRVSTPAIDMLMAYHWPGNVRELENCIERAVLLSTDGALHSRDLPPTLQTGHSSGTALVGTLKHTLELVERELVVEALKETRGNMAQAARKLGITERIMGLRVSKYDIDVDRLRARVTTRS